jgi:hypothetical protein
MLEAFHHSYPTGSLISELVQIYQGKYIVKVSIQVNNITLTTGLASAETIEKAEDCARQRALEVLNLTNLSQHVEPKIQDKKEENPLVLTSSVSQPEISPQVVDEPQLKIEVEVAEPTAIEPQLKIEVEVTEPTPVISPVEVSSKTKKKTETKTAIKAEIPIDMGEVVNQELPTIPTIPTVMETAETFPEPPPEDLPLEEFLYEPEFEQPAAETISEFPPATNSADLEQISEFPAVANVEDLGIINEFPAVTNSADLGTYTATETPLPIDASSNVMPFTPRSYTPIEADAAESEPAAVSGSKRKKKTETFDQSDDIAKIGVEMQRLGWTTDQGREYLINTYNKRSRHLLSTEEISNFLKYLESQPTPVDHLPLEPTF